MSIFSAKGGGTVLLHSLFSAKVARDPRFDDLSGEYNPEVFDKTYQFLDDIRAREKEVSSMVRRKKRQPTPVFLPGESQGRGSLVGCRLWGHPESDRTEAT